MKKTRYIMALVAAMFAVGAMLLVGCGKDSENSQNVYSSNEFTGNESLENLRKSSTTFSYGDFHNELLGNIVNMFDETLEFDSIEQVVEYVYSINYDYINGMELDENTKKICLSSAENYKNFISFHDFNSFILDNPEYEFSLQNSIEILRCTEAVSPSDYINLLDFSERILNILVRKPNPKDISDSILPIIIKSRDMSETEVAYAIFDIACGSFEFWDNHEDDGNYDMAPHVAVVDAVGAVVGAAGSALNQYATTGSVSNGWGVAVGAGIGAATASTGVVTKTAAAVEKAAVKAGKYLGKIISHLK